MKKRIILTIISCLLIASMLCIFVACDDLLASQNGSSTSTATDGKDGKDGREVEFNVSEDYIQWRYVGDTTWTNLVALSALKGEDGEDGKDGKDGQDGQDGQDGKDGKDGRDGITITTGDSLENGVGIVANTLCAQSVARIYMFKNATSNPSTAEASGLATAFLISDTNGTGTTERYMVTNAHCVRYEKGEVSSRGGFGGWYQEITYSWATYGTIVAMFENDDEIYNCEVVAYGAYEGDYLKAENSQADLAILKIVGTQPTNEDHASLNIVSTSNSPKRGDSVAIIGNPQGIGSANSIAVGTISQTGITISSWGSGSFFMTDAAINSGNSGGPVVDCNGNVVGVVESKLVSSSIDNMGFALEASTLIDFIDWVEEQNSITII